jgi:sterol desaturase/sphingolipid hydroxylase (fatty acid hydroxylase superfamily)
MRSSYRTRIGETMRLSTTTYYVDFAVYPALFTGLVAHGLAPASAAASVTFLATLGFGVGLWTFIEYLVHRFLFHRAPILHDLHEAHHAAPDDLIGAPIWASLPIALVILVSSILLLGTAAGGGLTAGLVAGYVWYISVHHLAHHGRLHGLRYLYRVRRRHAVHHSCDIGNFGVSTGFWDRVFGTVLVSAGTSGDTREGRAQGWASDRFKRFWGWRSWGALARLTRPRF